MPFIIITCREVKLEDKTFEVYITEEDLNNAINRLAEKINRDYAGKELFFIGILNGAFMFAGDLLKKITLPCTISFVKLASYEGASSSGKVHELIGLVNDLRNKNVIILEDIVDTGLTLDKIYSMIDHDHPSSLEVATLLYKPEAFNGANPPKYVGKEIENKFVVGYGLDYNGYGRNTKAVYKLKE